MKTGDTAGKLLGAGRLVINGKDYDLLPLASNINDVTLLLLPVDVPDEAVAQAMLPGPLDLAVPCQYVYATVLSGEGPQDGQEDGEDTPPTSNNREEAVSETAEVENEDSAKHGGDASSQISSHEAAASTDDVSANPLASAPA
ncbi:hypothetical protein HPB47_009204 [Ixodes persulcatus]|uniref:Uncharacterized protein n=1 Tax=Ixodes persulcatus TaxID=34615 RepID=A0AC60P2J9_IXOPE|nr:hypothetical protein HPB47_009204 [Ixodes persulcatus]